MSYVNINHSLSYPSFEKMLISREEARIILGSGPVPISPHETSGDNPVPPIYVVHVEALRLLVLQHHGRGWQDRRKKHIGLTLT